MHVKSRLNEQQAFLDNEGSNDAQATDNTSLTIDKLPRLLSNTAWSLAEVLSQTEAPLAVEIMLQIERMVPSFLACFSELEICNLLWALAKFHSAVGGLDPFILSIPHITRMLESQQNLMARAPVSQGSRAHLSPVKLAMLAWAYAVMQVPDCTELINTMGMLFLELLREDDVGQPSDVACAITHELSASQSRHKGHEIANMIWALSVSPGRPEGVITEISNMAAKVVESAPSNFKLMEIISVACSLSKAGARHARFFGVIHRILHTQDNLVWSLHSRDLAYLLDAMAKQASLGTDLALLQSMALLLSPACYKAFPWYKPQELCSVINSFAQLNFQAGDNADIDRILQETSNTTDQGLQALTPQGVTNLLQALVRFTSNMREIRRYQLFANRLCQISCGEFEHFSLIDLGDLHDTICSRPSSIVFGRSFCLKLVCKVFELSSHVSQSEFGTFVNALSRMSPAARQLESIAYAGFRSRFDRVGTNREVPFDMPLPSFLANPRNPPPTGPRVLGRWSF